MLVILVKTILYCTCAEGLFCFLIKTESTLTARSLSLSFSSQAPSAPLDLPVSSSSLSLSVTWGCFCSCQRKPVLLCGCRWDGKPARTSAGRRCTLGLILSHSLFLTCLFAQQHTVRHLRNNTQHLDGRSVFLFPRVLWDIHRLHHHFPLGSFTGRISINPTEWGYCMELCQRWLCIHIIRQATHTYITNPLSRSSLVETWACCLWHDGNFNGRVPFLIPRD